MQVLCSSVPLDHPLTIWHINLIISLLKQNGAPLQHIHPAVLSWGSLLTLAHHFSSRTLLWMQTFQTTEQRLKQALRLSFTPQQKQHQLLHESSAMRSIVDQVMGMVSVAMDEVSNKIIQNAVAKRNTGECEMLGQSRRFEGTYSDGL